MTIKRKRVKGIAWRVIVALNMLLGAMLLFSVSCYCTTSCWDQSDALVELEPPLRFRKNVSGRGFVVALSLWDQTTQATANLIQLQCWAQRHNLIVVEPFLNNSYLSATFNQTLAKNMRELHNIFNMDAWANASLQMGLPALVSMERLWLEGMYYEKDVILVQIYYPRYTQEPGVVKCDYNWERGLEGMGRLKLLKVVRSVCVRGNVPGASAKYLDNAIFAGRSSRDVVVIINEWRGIGPDRVRIHVPCSGAKRYTCRKPLSQKVIIDARAYANKYLGGVGNYIGIMARFERTTPKYWSEETEVLRKGVQHAMEAALSMWNSMKAQTLLSKTFLTFDYGKFGSDTFKEVYGYFDLEDLLEGFHQTIYNDQLSIAEWEQTFLEMSNTNNSAYMAALQLQIVVEAKCIILIGRNSNFLEYTLNLYRQNRPHDACAKLIGELDGYACQDIVSLE